MIWWLLACVLIVYRFWLFCWALLGCLAGGVPARCGVKLASLFVGWLVAWFRMPGRAPRRRKLWGWLGRLIGWLLVGLAVWLVGWLLMG